MRDGRNVAIVVVLLTVVTCLTVFLLKVGEPGGRLVELLFPRV